MSLDLTRRRLAALRGRIRTLLALNGLSMAVLAACLSVVALYALDRNLDLPMPVRMTLAAAAGVVVCVIAWRRLVRPVLVRLDDDHMAMLVEREHPDLGDQLISAVQLERAMTAQREALEASGASRELIEATVARTDDAVAGVDFASVLRTRRLRRLGLAAATWVIFLGVFAVMYPDHASAFMQRLSGDDAAYPRRTHLAVTTNPAPEAGVVTVTRGRAVEITVNVSGRVPDRAWLRFEYSDGDTGRERLIRPRSEPRFTYTFENTNRSFEFWVEGGDDVTDRLRVVALAPPRVQGVALRYDYPDYTRLTDTPENQPSSVGEAKAPIGTTVEVTALANRLGSGAGSELPVEITAAHLELGADDEAERIPMEIFVEGDRAHARGSFTITEKSSYRVILTGRYHLADGTLVEHTGDDPVRYNIEAERDTTPTLERVFPGRLPTEVTPSARIPFEFFADDDFGVRRVAWSLTRRHEGELSEPLEEILAGQGAEQDGDEPWPEWGLPELTARGRLTAPALEVVAGDSIFLQVRAWDYGVRPGGESASVTTLPSREPHRIRVVTPEEMRRNLAETLRQVKTTVERAIERQEEATAARTRAEEMIAEGVQADFVGDRLYVAVDVQDRVSGLMREVEDRLQDVYLQVSWNDLWNQSFEPDSLERMTDLAKEAAEEHSPTAAAAMADAQSARDDQRMAALATSRSAQERSAATLNELFELMDEWETFNAIVQAVEDLRSTIEDSQRRIQDDLDDDQDD